MTASAVSISGCQRSQLGDRAVEGETAEVRLAEVASVCVPGRLALQEQDLVAACGESLSRAR